MSGYSNEVALPRDALALAAAIEKGSTTASEQVERALERLDAVNPILNLLAWPCSEAAKIQARNRLMGRLAGVPTMIKDHVAQKGLPNSFGATALRYRIEQQDAPVMTAIKSGGLVPIGRTTMPEFGLNVVTESPLAGITRNPWSLNHSPGGSSGGSAAAVASGVVPVAHASDGLGSIRHAAAPCGLVGLKPSRGRVTGEGEMRTLFDLEVNGCVSRTVRDTAAWLDMTEIKGTRHQHKPVGFVADASDMLLTIVANPKIMRTGAYPHDSVMRVFESAITMLCHLGHRVKTGTLPFDGADATEAIRRFSEARFARKLAETAQLTGIPISVDNLEPRSADLVAQGWLRSDDDVARASEVLSNAAAAYLAQFDHVDVFMTPVFGDEIAEIGSFSPKRSWVEQRDRIADYAGYCWIDNLAGSTAISLPIGVSERGLPVGIQFAARPGADRILLELAYSLEKRLEWWRRKPQVWAGDPLP